MVDSLAKCQLAAKEKKSVQSLFEELSQLETEGVFFTKSTESTSDQLVFRSDSIDILCTFKPISKTSSHVIRLEYGVHNGRVSGSCRVSVIEALSPQ